MEKKIEVGLSILSGELLNLQREIAEARENGIDYLHLDMTDGYYVKSFGLKVETVKKICSEEKLRTRIHLIVFNPERYLGGVTSEEVYVHFHSTSYLLDFTRIAEKIGIKKGLVISPETDFRETYASLKYFDEVLFMGGEPGQKGQKFLEEVFYKIEDFVLHRPLEGDGELRKITIGIEGGVREENYKILKKIGVTDFIVREGYLNSKNKKDFVQRIKFS
jgi:ribulose-phosphate 3-epimerase